MIDDAMVKRLAVQLALNRHDDGLHERRMVEFAQACCAWQRERDAEICEGFSDSGFMFAEAVRNQS